MEHVLPLMEVRVIHSKRISWDKYFIEIVKLIAQRGTCPRIKHGAIIVKNNKIIGSGYNGSPSGMEHCEDRDCLMFNGHCLRTIHAEQNALLQTGHNARGGTLYCTGTPCPICIKLILQVGIKRIVYINKYRDDISKYWFNLGNIKVEQWKE